MDLFGCAGAVVLLLGLVSLGRTLASSGKRKGTDGWPSVPGLITASSVESADRSATVTIPGITSTIGKGPRIHIPRVQYAYTVGGQALTGSSIEREVTSHSVEAMARAVVNRYPVGAAVRVFHDPAAPGSCVLQVEGSGLFRDLAVGCAVLLLGAAFLLASVGGAWLRSKQ